MEFKKNNQNVDSFFSVFLSHDETSIIEKALLSRLAHNLEIGSEDNTFFTFVDGFTDQLISDGEKLSVVLSHEQVSNIIDCISSYANDAHPVYFRSIIALKEQLMDMQNPLDGEMFHSSNMESMAEFIIHNSITSDISEN